MDLVDKYFANYVSTNKSKEYTIIDKVNVGSRLNQNKDIEQDHLALAFDNIKYNGTKAGHPLLSCHYIFKSLRALSN